MEVRTSVVNRRNQDARENKKRENTTEQRRKAPESDTASPSTDRTRDMAKEDRKDKEPERKRKRKRELSWKRRISHERRR